MTRRRIPETARKNHIMKIRLDDIQYEMISDLAKEAGMNMTEYIRQQAVYGKVDIHNHIVADFPALEQIAKEFSQIGNNLNQLTKYFNSGGLRSQAMYEQLTRCINEVMKMRKAIMEMAGEYRGYTKTSGK